MILLLYNFIVIGASINEVQAMVENHLKSVILKTFDPKKADTIFTEEGDAPAWLTELIEHSTWRSVVYKLAEEFPDCLMLNFTIKVYFRVSICFIQKNLDFNPKIPLSKLFGCPNYLFRIIILFNDYLH